MKKEAKKQVEESSTMAGGNVEGAARSKDADEGYFINREEFLRELQLREVVRRVITIAEQKQKTKLNEEVKLRTLIRRLITESEADTTPHASTAINFLEDLLKRILPSIEQDYKSLTTKTEQRESFRAQLIASVKATLETANINTRAADAAAAEEEGFIEIEEAEEDITIDVTDDADDTPEENKFIDIDETDPEEEETAAEDTGSKLAAQSFDNIEKQVTETYNTLSDEEDQKTFQDYLITNLKLYFDKWEQELGDVIEPTTPEYEEDKEEEELAGEEDLEL